MGRVLQVVGFQNSGKTTFVVDYIKAAAKFDLKIGTIKHHGHREPITIDDQQKDTGKHRHAGALISAVEGNGAFVLTSEIIPLSLSQLLYIYSQFQLDIIVVEGYKSASYPKVVLLRSPEDWPILDELTNICCVVTSVDLPFERTKRHKTFKNTQDCIEWLLINRVGEIID